MSNLYLKTVSQTIFDRCDSEWLNLYKQYQRYDSRVVRVDAVRECNDHNSEPVIVMERLNEGFPLDDRAEFRLLTTAQQRHCLDTMMSLYNAQLQWNSELLKDDEAWMHGNFKLQSLWWTAGEIRLIDPESWFVNPLQVDRTYSVYSKFFETYIKLMSWI